MKPYTIGKDSEMYFCTDTIVGWQHVFASYDSFNVIIDSLKYCQVNKGLRVHGYVIMPNHVHTILSAQNGNLQDILRDFKRFTSKTVSELLTSKSNKKLLRYFRQAALRDGKGNDFKIWQSGSHAEIVYSMPFFEQKLNYIHENPVRKGFVHQPEHWVYSSARNYILNDHSVIRVLTVE